MRSRALRPLVYSLLVLLTLPFANGRWIIPIAAWLGPLFLVRLLRSLKELYGLVLGYCLFLICLFLQWRGAIKGVHGPLVEIGLAALVFLSFLPFVMDRLYRNRLPGFASTLVLPLSWVACDFALARGLANVCSIAYSQVGDLPLLQLVSVTGTFGITFLIGWFASVMNWAWEREFEWRLVRRGLGFFFAIFVGIHVWGGWRLLADAPSWPLVRAAGITVDLEHSLADRVSEFYRKGGNLSPAEEQAMRAEMDRLDEQLAVATYREMAAGAKLVTWSEVNAHVFASDEKTMLASFSKLAADQKAYLFLTEAVFHTGQPKIENKMVGLGPDGSQLFEYLKSRLSPGEPSVQGHWELPVVSTNFGILSGAICADFTDDAYLRQAGTHRVDIMAEPASEWKEIDPIHSTYAIFRAVENGFNLIKQANFGRSIAVDYLGHTLGQTNYFLAADKTLVADLPTHGIGTIYAFIGDLFPWTCVIALLIGLFRKPLLKQLSIALGGNLSKG